MGDFPLFPLRLHTCWKDCSAQPVHDFSPQPTSFFILGSTDWILGVLYCADAHALTCSTPSLVSIRSVVMLGRHGTAHSISYFLTSGVSDVFFSVNFVRKSRTLPSTADRLVGLVVKASASRAEDPGFESFLRRDFSVLSHTSDLKIGTPVATLPDAWGYRVSAGTGRPGVSIL